jgi:hypothetical protein
MTANNDPYSRLYWRFREEFPEVYADKPLFGWWASLLMIAEGAHPSAAELPRRIKPSVLDALVKAELLEILPGDRFRIRGVTKERERRAEAARVGGLASGRSRTPEQSANVRSTNAEQPLNVRQPRRDEQRRAEKRQDEPRKDETPPAGAEKHGSKNLDEERDALVHRLKTEQLSADMTNAVYARIEQIDNTKAMH